MPRKISSLPYMAHAQVQWFKQLLEAQVAATELKTATLKDTILDAPHESDDEVGRATREEEIAKARGLEQRYLEDAASCRRALSAIESGDYGYCAETGEEIGLLRLQARPDALYCIAAQHRRERRANQYAPQWAYA